VELAGRVRPEHLVAVSIEASLEFLEPAAIFVPSATGSTARRLASLHLPVRVVAIGSSEKTCRDLQFSYGVTAVHEPIAPPSWTEYVKDWLRREGVSGEFAILTQRSPFDDPAGNHRMEIVSL
jgi:pyruvate kinase